MPYSPENHTPHQHSVRTHRVADRWGSGRGGRQWRNRRERIFKRDKYLCQIHLGMGEIRPVTLHGQHHGVCDHIIAMAHGGTDDESNLQTICQACDKRKTSRESNGGV